MAFTRELETPWAAPMAPTADAGSRDEVAYGGADGATGAAGCAGVGLDAAPAEPVGSFSAVPATIFAFGDSPFIQAIWLTGMPLRAASPESVSPARTM